MVNLKDACKRLDISYSTVLKYVKMGLIKTIRMGRKYRIPEEEIERVLREGIVLPEAVNDDNNSSEE